MRLVTLLKDVLLKPTLNARFESPWWRQGPPLKEGLERWLSFPLGIIFHWKWRCRYPDSAFSRGTSFTDGVGCPIWVSSMFLNCFFCYWRIFFTDVWWTQGNQNSKCFSKLNKNQKPTLKNCKLQFFYYSLAKMANFLLKTSHFPSLTEENFLLNLPNPLVGVGLKTVRKSLCTWKALWIEIIYLFRP